VAFRAETLERCAAETAFFVAEPFTEDDLAEQCFAPVIRAVQDRRGLVDMLRARLCPVAAQPSLAPAAAPAAGVPLALFSVRTPTDSAPLRQLHTALQAVFGPQSVAAAFAQVALAVRLWQAGDIDESVSLAAASEQVLSAVVGLPRESLVGARYILGELLLAAGRASDAVEALGDASARGCLW
jgi:hypothetical protein